MGIPPPAAHAAAWVNFQQEANSSRSGKVSYRVNLLSNKEGGSLSAATSRCRSTAPSAYRRLCPQPLQRAPSLPNHAAFPPRRGLQILCCNFSGDHAASLGLN